MTEKMNYKGIVTSCNPKLCCFTLDDIVLVYCGYNFVNEVGKLPLLHEEVILSDGQLYDSKYIFLTKESQIFCKNYCADDKNQKSRGVVQLITELKLGAADLLRISHCVKKFNDLGAITSEYLTNILDIPNKCSEDIILRIIPHIARTQVNSESIFNEVLPYFEVNTPSKFKIDKNAKKLVSGSYWTFGVNSNEEHEILIGFLHLSEKLGFTVLADKNYFLVCIIVPEEQNKFSSQMQDVMNKLVMIRNYKIFSEMFQDIDVIQYAYFSTKNIQVIDIPSTETIHDVKYNSEFDISILHRSSLIYQESQFYCLIHCKVQEDMKDHDILLKIKGNNLRKYPFIHKGDKYKLQFPEEKTDIQNEIRKVEGNFLDNLIGMQSHLKSFSLPSTTKMLLETRENENDKLLSVEDAVALLKSGHNKVISFEGVIVQKKFMQPLESRKKKPVKNIAFGTAGGQIHQIILKNCRKLDNCTAGNPEDQVFYDKEQKDLEELYENNCIVKQRDTLAFVYLYYWEKLHCPLGLLPDMRVAVKYFYPQNGKYFKPTILSIIEPLQYEPIAEFNTCYELQDNMNWGSMFYLGDGEVVPTDCVCWGPTETIKIANLTISHTCTICDTKISLNQISCCDKTDYNMNVMLVMSIRDKAGNADILTKSHNVFKLLMDYNEEQWKLFKETMKMVTFFVYSPSQNEIQIDLQDQYIKFVNLLYLQINIWNLTEIHTLDLKCRKLDKSFRDIPFTPKWYCIEARNSEVR